jgi:hypothetical protein
VILKLISHAAKSLSVTTVYVTVVVDDVADLINQIRLVPPPLSVHVNNERSDNLANLVASAVDDSVVVNVLTEVLVPVKANQISLVNHQEALVQLKADTQEDGAHAERTCPAVGSVVGIVYTMSVDLALHLNAEKLEPEPVASYNANVPPCVALPRTLKFHVHFNT